MDDLGAPPRFLTRITSPSGPPRPVWIQRAGTSVLALPGRYCMTYLVVERQQVAVVDVGSTADVALVLRALHWLGSMRVLYALPTHMHFDHMMGLDRMARELGAPIALGAVARRAVERQERLPFPARWAALRSLPGYVMQGLPLAPLGDWCEGLGYGFPWSANRFSAPLGPTLDADGPLPGFSGWRVLSTPGHSPDSICLHHASAGILIAGDTVRNYRGGEWNRLLHDTDAYQESRARLCSLRVQTICPGHGPVLCGQDVLLRLR